MGVYEDLIVEIRSQSPADRGEIELAVMTGPDSLNLGGLMLTSEDLLFDESLVHQVATRVAGIVNDTEFQDKTTYLSALKAGDMVAVKRYSDQRYLVLGKMVHL